MADAVTMMPMPAVDQSKGLRLRRLKGAGDGAGGGVSIVTRGHRRKAGEKWRGISQHAPYVRPYAAGGKATYYIATLQGNGGEHGLCDRVSRRRIGRGLASWHQYRRGALAPHRLPLRDHDHQYHRLAGDWPDFRLLPLSWRRLTKLA